MAESAGCDSLGNSSLQSKTGGGGGVGAAASTAAPRRSGSVTYKECLKNHAVNIGEHAVDGCGEFMPGGGEGTFDALKCAACNCHRNFHRKETEGESSHSLLHLHHHQQQQQQQIQFYRPPPPAGYLQFTPSPRPLAPPSASCGGGYGREEEDVSNPINSGEGGGSGVKKRFRTKFTQEQKEKMVEFAERLGWRIQKHDDGAVEEFCAETGVKRHVLKVWMHNNKHTLGKKP